MSASIVVLTKYPEIIHAWTQEYQRFPSEGTPVYVYSDGAPPDAHPKYHISGPRPFIAACNVNLGMHAVWPNDVLLCCDDAVFTQPQTLERLQALAEAHPEYGIISPAIEGEVCFGGQKKGVFEGQTIVELDALANVCCYIKRKVIESIGGWDERFTQYGWDDVDYGLRARLAGWKLGVAPGIVVKHGYGDYASGASYMMTAKETGKDIGLAHNTSLFVNKWKHAMHVIHDFKPAYLGGLLREAHNGI